MSDMTTHPIPIRTTREYFLDDAALKRALGLDPKCVILEVRRKTASFRGRAVGMDQPMDLSLLRSKHDLPRRPSPHFLPSL